MALSQQLIFGQYIEKKSIIHKLDPRTKLLIVMFFMISALFLTTLVSYAMLAFMVAAAIAISKIPVSYIIKGLKPIWLIVIITSVFHIFLTQGGEVLFQIGPLSFYEQGVLKAIMITVRIVLLLAMATLLTLTTKLSDLTSAIETLLSPLRRIGVPTQEIAMMMTLTIRFIPILLQETDKIMKAQRARGVNFSSGNVVKRLLNFIPIIVPVLMLAFQKAESASQAIEARGYRPGMQRTQLRTLVLQAIDYKAMLLCGLLLTVLIALRL
ncbi:energy-coupling factor transporter transmembrane protein EcfT [Paenibacillus sp. YSY-4.3]